MLPSIPLILLLLSYLPKPTQAGIGLVDSIYCGLDTCYDILDVTRDTDKKTIRKKYKALSLKNHPDKFLNDKNSGKITEEEFAELEKKYSIINVAYDTLKDEEKKADYNHYLDHPEDRYYNYYKYYSNKLKSKVTVDVKLVIIGFLLAWSGFQWVGWTNAYSQVLTYALSDNKYRLQAKKLAIQRGLLEEDGKIKKNLRRKAEFKNPNDAKKEVERILKEIIEENVDIRGGYGKPHWTDVALVQFCFIPKYVYVYFKNKCTWWYRRNILKAELTDEEKWILIEKNCMHSTLLGDMRVKSKVEFEYLKDKKGDGLWAGECWDSEKCVSHFETMKEEERIKNIDSGKAKQYKRYLKRNKGENRMTFNENDEGGWED